MLWGLKKIYRINISDRIRQIKVDIKNKNKQIIITGDDRITSNILSRFERTKVIGERATQIENGASIYTGIIGLTESTKMAELELNNNKCPYIIKRFIGTRDGIPVYEKWSVNELTK